jgi:hypothetical protein
MSVAATKWAWSQPPKKWVEPLDPDNPPPHKWWKDNGDGTVTCTLGKPTLGVLLFMADRWPGGPDDDSEAIEPLYYHQDVIADSMNMSVRSVNYAVTQLEAMGILEVIRSADPYDAYPIRYRMRFPTYATPRYVPRSRRLADARTARSYSASPTKQTRHLRAVRNDDAQPSLLDLVDTPSSETAGHEGGSSVQVGYPTATISSETAGHEGGSSVQVGAASPTISSETAGHEGGSSVQVGGVSGAEGGSSVQVPPAHPCRSSKTQNPNSELNPFGVEEPAPPARGSSDDGASVPMTPHGDTQKPNASVASQGLTSNANPSSDQTKSAAAQASSSDVATTEGGSSADEDPWANFHDVVVTDPATIKTLKGAVVGAYAAWVASIGGAKPAGTTLGMLGKAVEQGLQREFTPAEIADATQAWHYDQARHPSRPAQLLSMAERTRTRKLNPAAGTDGRVTAPVAAQQARKAAVAAVRERFAARKAATTADDDVVDVQVVDVRRNDAPTGDR